MSAEVDHLVVAAATLEQGVQWCESVLGVTPGPGGKHAFIGTHNRLLSVASPAFPRAYLEVIAIDPDAPAPPRPRWFGLDTRPRDAAPGLVHFVARTADVRGLRAALAAIDHDPGEPRAASRDTARGTLRWTITLREDGRMVCAGALPTLIEWQDAHPSDMLPASSVSLLTFEATELPNHVATALGLPGVVMHEGQGAALRASLQTPRGIITIQSTDRNRT